MFKKGNFNFFIITIILCWVTINVNLNKYWDQLVEYDIAGYYAYLPATFIYQDLQFDFSEKITQKYSPDKSRGDYRNKLEEGKTINKFYAGTAILQTPFFAIAHGVTVLSGGEADGYSYWYMVGLAMSSIFYTIVGLIFFGKILDWHKVSTFNKWLVIYAVTFGTNIFVYASIDPGMSHPYSFACISALIWHFILFKESEKAKHYFFLCALVGLITLIRPINVIAILGLFFFLDSKKDIPKVFSKLINLGYKIIPGLLLAIGIGAIQLLFYKLQTDDWIVYSYGEETFNFGNPEIINFLFSYRKGYFLYTPLAFLSLLCLYYLFKRNSYKFLTLSSFLFLLIYIFSSWWNWWYGGSFSSRVMLEYSIFIFLPLGLYLQNTKPSFRKLLTGIIIILILFCQIQIYQFRYNQIHYADTTKEMYWENFLRIDKLIK